MKNRITHACVGSLVLSMMAVTAGLAAGQEPLVHSRRLYESADGGFCSQVGDLWRCRQFAAEAYSEPSGKYLETIVRMDQWRNWSNGYAYRHVECPVPRASLRVTPNQAVVSVTFDAEGPGCFGYGETVTYDPWEVTPWLYTGMQTLEADLLNPGNQHRGVTGFTTIDNILGTSYRENCHGGSGWNLQGGGFTMLGLYRSFGPGEASGSFYYSTCGITN